MINEIRLMCIIKSSFTKCSIMYNKIRGQEGKSVIIFMKFEIHFTLIITIETVNS
jgi:hypothetical protein